MNIKRLAIGVAVYLCLFAVGFVLAGSANASENTDFNAFGCVKMDTDCSDAELAANSALRDFLIPGTIPPRGENEHANFDVHAKASHFILEEANNDAAPTGTGANETAFSASISLRYPVQYGCSWNSL